MLVEVTLFCIVCAAWWLWRRNNANTTEPPWYPGAWPIVGHVPMFIGDTSKLWTVLNDMAKQSYELGGVVRAKIGPRIVYTISDPDDCNTVATTCLEKDPFYELARPWLGDGLITARYSTWRVHRKLLNPAFSQIMLNTFMDVFNSQGRKLVDDLEKEAGRGPFDHLHYTRSNALESIGLTSLGVDVTDSNTNNEYTNTLERLMKILMERFVKFWWHSPYTFAWSNLKKEQDACLKIMHNVSNTVLQNRKSKLYENTSTETSIPETKFKPFIDLLLELSLEKGALNDHEIRNHVDTMLVGGQDTSASALMFTMVLLGSYPEVQQKVFAEILEVLGEGRDVKKTDLSKFVYLEAVLKESLRLYPVVPVVARISDRDVKLKNCTISAGQTCMLLLFAVQKHPIWGPDAHEFKPERWLDPARLPDNPNAFAAFGLGKRHCLGKVYAMMSAKTTLVHLVRRYRITGDHTKMRLKIDIMLNTAAGHYISLERRT